MHKDIPVLKGDYSFSSHSFEQGIEILNAEHCPIGSIKEEKKTFSLRRLNHWWRWRGIPGYRVGLIQLEQRLSIRDPLDLLERSHGVSLSDTYWLKREDEDIDWRHVNFFTHSFDQSGFGKAMFSSFGGQADSSARHTPNNTTAGYHRKAWFHRQDGLYLLKGGSPFYQQEPINEWLASEIGSRLNLDSLSYTTEIYENNLVSVCKAMTSDNIDLVPAENVLASLSIEDLSKEPFAYVNALKKHGIEDPLKNISDMYLLDYLLLNSDRHTQNFGILVDAKTNKWLRCAPVFDTGTGLGALYSDEEIIASEHADNARVFNLRNIKHNALISMIDLRRYDFDALDGLPRIYGEKLLQYQSMTGISNRRINDAYKLFYHRIYAIKKAQARYI